MRSVIRHAATLVVAITLSAASVQAQTVSFTGHGTATNPSGLIPPGDFTFSFLLPQSPTPTAVGFDYFMLRNVNGTLTQNGIATAVTWSMDFYDASDYGGFAMWTPTQDAVIVGGPALFTGPTSNPVFKAGTYTGFTAMSLSDQSIGPTIADVTITSSVPEPSSTALLGTGLVGFLPMVWRRRKPGRASVDRPTVRAEDCQ